MSNALRYQALLISGLLGFIVPTWFAWTLYVDHKPQNIATWGMVLVLDGLGLILAYKGGNKKPFLQLGWVVAALCIFVAVLFNGNPVLWGWTETASVVLGGIAIVLWISCDAGKALWAYMAAMYISFVPLMADYWKEPQPDTLWLWLLTIVACLFAILGAEKYNFANLFVPVAAAALNVAVTVLCLL